MTTPNEKVYRAHDARKIDAARKLDPALSATNEREAMTHEIVHAVTTLTARLAKHKDGNERAKAERIDNEIAVLNTVLSVLPMDLFGPLAAAQIEIADTAAGKLAVMHDDGAACWAMTGTGHQFARVGTPYVQSLYALDEVIGGLCAALAERIDSKHEHGRKLTRVNRKLRGILSILDNS